MAKEVIVLQINTEDGKSKLFGSDKIEKVIRKEYKKINNMGIKGQAIPMVLAQHLTESFAKKKIYAKREIDGIVFDETDDNGLKFVLGWEGKYKMLKKVLKKTSKVYASLVNDFKEDIASE